MNDTATADSRTARGEMTRRKIVAVAERLFAERGIEGVSLNDINKAAGQRNKNATHYHFGSKEGLLQAIHDKHEPGISARRDELLDEMEAHGELNLRNVVRAMVRPLAEKLDDPDGGPEYVRFCAHTVVTRTMSVLKAIEPMFTYGSVERLVAVLEKDAVKLPDPLRMQRGLMLAVMLTHSLAEYCNVLDQLAEPDRQRATELFVSDLEDTLAAVLATPPSRQTLSLLPGRPVAVGE